MGSWIVCICGGRIHTNMFAGTKIYQLIMDEDYDAIEDPVDRDKLSALFFDKGVTVYRCHRCGRLLVEWDKNGAPTFYVPEGKLADTPDMKTDDDQNNQLLTEEEVFYYLRGIYYSRSGRYSDAIAYYTKALELKPDYAEAYCDRGKSYYRLLNDQQAIADYDKAIEIWPDFHEAYYNRGNSYYRLLNNQRAINDYSKAIEIWSGYEEAYNSRGNAYRALGDYEQAINDYTKVLELNPRHEGAYTNLVLARDSLRKLKESGMA